MLQRDVLLNEVTSVRTDMAELRDHLDWVYEKNITLNCQKSELEVKLKKMAREVEDLEDEVNHMHGQRAVQAWTLDNVKEMRETEREEYEKSLKRRNDELKKVKKEF